MNIKGILIATLMGSACYGQNITTKLTTALQQIAQDAQFKYASVGMYVVNSETGAVVFEKNAQMGMATASSQKVVTSITAFELLGKAYQYNTTLGYTGTIENGVLKGNLIISGGGDPTLGSWRYGGTKENVVLDKWVAAVKAKGIQSIEGQVLGDARFFTSNATPDGWIWQDIGNYFGAGAYGLNWRENQLDITLQPGNKIGAPTSITSVVPAALPLAWENEVTTGAKGSGDNAYIYLAPYTNNGFIRGTVPLGENNFNISGAMPNPPLLLAETLTGKLRATGITVKNKAAASHGLGAADSDLFNNVQTLVRHSSPTLDSINYWFLKKSVNLYGEALLKTLAVEQGKPGNTDSGAAILRWFWAKRGIDKEALKMIDGSGLSPQNRVTAKALVTVMQYARNKPWFTTFYNALPLMNGLNMKDGYINGVRTYVGYSKSRSGDAYTFCLMVNNFDGSPSTAREKLWAVLNLLK